jgi:hypothetical protein
MNEKKLPQRVLNCKPVVDSPRVKGETFVARIDNVTYNVAWRRGRRRRWSRGTKTHFLQSLASKSKTGG